MKTNTKTLIKALRILSEDIQSDDGIANACIREAADRIEELQEKASQLNRIEKAYLNLLKTCTD